MCFARSSVRLPLSFCHRHEVLHRFVGERKDQNLVEIVFLVLAYHTIGLAVTSTTYHKGIGYVNEVVVAVVGISVSLKCFPK